MEAGGLPTRPLSPWAQRFSYNVNGRDPILDDDEIHSGLAPVWPGMHPKFYADKPVIMSGQPTNQTLDTAFISEMFQRSYLRGFESWQAGPLSQFVFLSDKVGIMPGGHQERDEGPVKAVKAPEPAKPEESKSPGPAKPEESKSPGPVKSEDAMDVDDADDADERLKEEVIVEIFHANRIKVDEDKWFPFLKKSRWYDTIGPDQTIGGVNWSVDNPKIWDVLSISIELLDRILKALVADKHVWLQTILYGLLARWDQITPDPPPDPDASVLLSHPFYSQRCRGENKPCPIDFILNFTPENWTERLIHLMTNQTWGFTSGYDNSTSVWGVTIHRHRGMILIDNGSLRRIISDKVTLSERCFLHYNIAVTMMHEIAHSLIQYRQMDTSWPENLPSISWMTQITYMEPFVDFDGASEMGFAAEQRIFGGEFFIGTFVSIGSGTLLGGLTTQQTALLLILWLARTCKDLPLGPYRMGWPEPFKEPEDEMERMNPNHPVFQVGSPIYTHRIPSLHVSKLLSAQFWDDQTILKKSDNGFHFRPLITNTTLFRGLDVYLAYNPTQLINPLPTQLLPGEAEMIQAWRDRENDMRTARSSWYLAALDPWLSSPGTLLQWANHKQRQTILRFARGFARKDELECRFIAEQLVDRIPWKEGRQKYIDAVLSENIPFQWIYHAIGLLMLAALPIRNHPLANNDEYDSVTTFVPSREATQLHIRTDVLRPRTKDLRIVDPAELWDPLGRPEAGKITNFFHEDYINLVDALFKELGAHNVEVSMPWVRQITRTADDLRTQRRAVRRGTRGKETWAAWRFIVPAYTSTTAKFQDGRWVTIVP
ncbi:hypothetical protein EKO27_g9425 [Xylaria grammica]|uniref:Uncharacterized protein n=1 Tax=Xylaria grammica TaxID=363999 RepID=A0A439CU77_9PEZI|nr:hypothetical protein EKO27_g9425 [Xylaria grammica]